MGGDTPDTQDVFARDLQAHTTERVSLDRTGQPFDQGSYAASISSNGRYVACGAGAASRSTADSA